MIGYLRRLLVVSVGAAMATLALSGAHAQDNVLRQLIITENADYPGNDYQTLRDVDQNACEAACLDDNQCRAFTFNTTAGWCFLKSDFGALTLADNAVAGRVVANTPPSQSLESLRQAELTIFLAPDYVDEARRFAGALDATFAPGVRSYNELLLAAANARSADNPALAANLFGAALALAPEDPKIWIEFGRATLLRTGANYSERNEIRTRATSAAINAYLRATTDATRASALVMLGNALGAAPDLAPCDQGLSRRAGARSRRRRAGRPRSACRRARLPHRQP